MLWAAGIGRAAYDPETISMLTTVLERALAALPRQDRTEERKTRLASSILGAAARGERDPLLLYATALGGGPWEPAIGEGPASQPIRSIYGQRPESRSRGRRGRGFRGIASRGMNGCLNNFTKDAELEFCSRNDGYFCALNPRSDACPQRR
jgi:hypothetical protein